MAFSKITLLTKLDTTESIAVNDPFPAHTENVSTQVGGSQDLDTYDFVKSDKITIAGGANTTLDLWASMVSHGASITKLNPTKLRGYFFKTSGVESTADLLVQPGASSPAPTGLISSSPAAETPGLKVKAGGGICVLFASHETLSNSLKNVKLSNTGSTTVTVIYGFILGGGTNS